MAPFFLLEEFVRFLQMEKRYSDHTVLAYQKDVEQFLAHAEITRDAELKEVTHSLIRSWMVALIEKGIENKSVNRKISSLRTFF